MRKRKRSTKSVNTNQSKVNQIECMSFQCVMSNEYTLYEQPDKNMRVSTRSVERKTGGANGAKSAVCIISACIWFCIHLHHMSNM